MRVDTVRLSVTLDRRDFERLTARAVEMAVPPARLAASLIATALEEKDGERSAPDRLFAWLVPFLEDLRSSGNWNGTVTYDVFTKISADARDLYDAAAAEVGRLNLNREIGRFVRQELRARPVTRNGSPVMHRYRPAPGRLVKAVTVLEPDPTASAQAG